MGCLGVCCVFGDQYELSDGQRGLERWGCRLQSESRNQRSSRQEFIIKLVLALFPTLPYTLYAAAPQHKRSQSTRTRVYSSLPSLYFSRRPYSLLSPPLVIQLPNIPSYPHSSASAILLSSFVHLLSLKILPPIRSSNPSHDHPFPPLQPLLPRTPTARRHTLLLSRKRT